MADLLKLQQQIISDADIKLWSKKWGRTWWPTSNIMIELAFKARLIDASDGRDTDLGWRWTYNTRIDEPIVDLLLCHA